MKTYHIQWLIALATSISASAQPPRPPSDRRPPPVPPIFAVFDTDHDKVLSAKEIEAASAVLAKMDKNGDGEITLDELRPPGEKPNGKKPKGPEGPPPGERPPPPLIKALDADGDGTISAAELEGAPASLKTLDEDGDGALSPEELRPHGPPPRPDGPPPEDGAGAE